MDTCGFFPKAVLWDLDDTLYSRREAAGRMYPGLLRACLYPNRSEEFTEQAAGYLMAHLRGNSMTSDSAFQALLARYPADKPYVWQDCLDYYYSHILRYAAPDAGAMAVVQKLKTLGVKMAIVTNIVPELLQHQKRKVAALGIAEFFDAIVYSAELGVHKPDRRIFDHAAALLGVANENCLFVGDDPDSDVAGARAADMEVVWLDRWNTDSAFAGDRRVHRVRTAEEYFTSIGLL